MPFYKIMMFKTIGSDITAPQPPIVKNKYFFQMMMMIFPKKTKSYN